jgi:hypothetical protein
MLSLDVWINGISGLIIIIYNTVFSIFLLTQSRKHNIKLLLYFGLFTIFLISSVLIHVVDFCSILFFGGNFVIEGVNLPLIFSWMWTPPVMICASFVGAELIAPQKRNYIVMSIFIIGIIYELFIFLNPTEYLILNYPEISGERLMDSVLKIGSPPFFIYLIYFGYAIGFHVIGGTIRAIQSKGIVRKKLFNIALGSFFIVLAIGIEGFSFPGLLIAFSRSGLILGFILFYLGLKPQKSDKTKKKKPPSDEMIKLSSYMLGKPKLEEVKDEIHIEAMRIGKEMLIFISYATKDVDTFKIHEVAKILTTFPEIKNVLFWEEYMEDNIFEYMDENLEKCDAMILFCSENAKDSVPVKKEWTAAEAIGLPIIPVFYDVDHIPTLLKSRLGLEFNFYDMERNIQELRNLILKKVGGLAE